MMLGSPVDQQGFTFNLSYKRARPRRSFTHLGIEGPAIDHAHLGEGKTPGEWADDATDAQPGDLPREWFRMAINEAVHEALEWFQKDGEPVLDPHGYWEDEIYDEVAALAARLWELGASSTGDGEDTGGEAVVNGCEAGSNPAIGVPSPVGPSLVRSP